MDGNAGIMPADLTLRGGRFDLLVFRLLLASVVGVAFSIVLGQILLAATILLFLVALLSREFVLRLPRMLLVIALFAVIALLATIKGVNTDDGLRAMPQLLWYAAIPVCVAVVSSQDRLRRVLTAFALGAVVLSLKILVLRSCEAWNLCSDDLIWTHAGFLAAVVHLGSMTDGQMLMMGIVCATGLLFIAHTEKRNRVLWWLVLALLVVAQLANFKRGSWMVTVAVLGLFLVLQTNWRYLLLLLAATVAFAALPPVRARLATFRTEFNVDGGGRLTMWLKLTPGFIRKHPLGIGYGAMTEDMMQEEARAQGVYVEKKRNHLHSNLAQVLVETGWAGFVVYLAWMAWATVAAARLAVSARGSPVPAQVCSLMPLLMLVGLLANGLIEYNFGDTELLIVYSVLMGLAISKRELRPADNATQ